MTTERILPPTQDLVMEVLAARARTGEVEWSFATRHMGTIRRLAELGLVTWRAHNIYGHVYVRLTDAGRAEYLGDEYVPPILANEDRIAQAIGDPGSIVGRRDPGESVTRWSTRAVITTLLRAAR